MTSQFFIFNITDRKMKLKVHKPHTLEWYLYGDSSYSFALPIDANHETKYKIKHKSKHIAELWINHNGIITGIKNHSKKYSVVTDEIDYDYPHKSGMIPTCHGQQAIYIIDNRHHC